MIRRLYRGLPGPRPIKVLLAIVIIAVLLVALGVLFEQAGSLLDTGGVIQ